MIFRVMVLGCLLAVAHRAVSATEIYRTAAQPESAPKYIQMADGRIGDSASSCFDCWSARSPPCASRGSALCAPQATGETGAFRPARLHLRRGRQPGPSQPLPLSAAPIFTVRYHLAVRSDDPVEIRQWNDVRALGEGHHPHQSRQRRIERLQALQDSSSTAAGSAVLPIMTSC